MIKLQGKLPRQLWLACSGGVDSMAALDFLSRNHQVNVLHFNHNTAHGEVAQAFVERQCAERGLPLTCSEAKGTVPPGPSREAWWREQRYEFFDTFFTVPVITCHHLDDCVESWGMSSLQGQGKWIPYRRRHVIRPFRLNRKRELELWCNLNNVPWIDDNSNEDIHYTRNYVRHQMMPHVLKVNAGIHKTIRKKVMEDFNEQT